jgi:translation elongation factor EF-Tu-like GTPase
LESEVFKMSNDGMVTTVRFPRSVWARMKHLQADGKIKSMQEAVLKGLEMYFKILDRTDGDEDGK